MKRQCELLKHDDWKLVIDMPLDNSIVNQTGFYVQSGNPSSWVDDPSDSSRKVACFNTKGPVVYPDANYELKQSVYANKFRMSIDFWKINYTSGNHPNLIDSCYGGGWQTTGGLGIQSQCTSRSIWHFGISDRFTDTKLEVSKTLIPIQKWFRYFLQYYNDFMDIVLTDLQTGNIVAEKHTAITTVTTLDSSDKCKLRLGANNQWSDDRTSYAYLRNFKLWLH
jgi:hypothetical protein